MKNFEVEITEAEKAMVLAMTDSPEYEAFISILNKMVAHQKDIISSVEISEKETDIHRGEIKRLNKLINLRQMLLQKG